MKKRTKKQQAKKQQAKRRDYRRKRTREAPPTDGFLMAELVRLSGTSQASIKAYIRRGLLDTVEFHGRATRYPPAHLLRIVAVRLLRAKGLQLDQARDRLNAWAPEDLTRWVLAQALMPDTLAALRLLSSETARKPAGATGERVKTPEAGSLAAHVSFAQDSWQRVVLMPGLELQLKADAPSVTQRVAQELCRHFSSMLEDRLRK